MRGNLRVIGKCPGCQIQSILVEGCCKGCSKFGPRFGALATRVRLDPEFKRKCYELLSTDSVRADFVSMFGPLDPARGSADMAEGSR